MATEETRQLIEAQNYTLILDEALQVLEDIPLKKHDLEHVLDKELGAEVLLQRRDAAPHGGLIDPSTLAAPQGACIRVVDGFGKASKTASGRIGDAPIPYQCTAKWMTAWPS